jgi:hypothetical protein
VARVAVSTSGNAGTEMAIQLDVRVSFVSSDFAFGV